MKNRIVNLVKEVAFFLMSFFLGSIYRLMLVFPINQNLVFVNCFDGKGFGDNPKPIVQELHRRDRSLTVIWLFKGHADAPESYVEYVRPMSIKALYFQARAKIWIGTVRMPYYVTKRAKQKYFQTWHGSLGIKKVENECKEALSPRYLRTAKHDSKMIDVYLSPNQDTTELFTNNFWKQGGQIVEIGSPRNDVLVNCHEADKTKVKARLGIDSKKHLLVYAPTFRADGGIEAYNLDLLEVRTAFERRFGGEWVIGVRLHPRISGLGREFAVPGKIFDFSKITDSQAVLLAADALITDYSSIGFDFFATKLPVFIYASDIDDYQKDRSFHVPLNVLPFSLSSTTSDFIRRIDTFDVAVYQEKISHFKNKYGFIESGDATKRAADLILK